MTKDWPVKWGPGSFPEDLAIPAPARSVSGERQSADSHLRSTAVVTGYRIEASDGEIGHVEDFVIDQGTWKIRYLEVKTRNWLPGKMVLMSPEWVEKVSWPESNVSVGLSRETIKSAPEYIESRPITRDYENLLHRHYGRAPYWLQETGQTQVRRAGSLHCCPKHDGPLLSPAESKGVGGGAAEISDRGSLFSFAVACPNQSSPSFNC